MDGLFLIRVWHQHSVEDQWCRAPVLGFPAHSAEGFKRQQLAGACSVGRAPCWFVGVRLGSGRPVL